MVLIARARFVHHAGTSGTFLMVCYYSFISRWLCEGVCSILPAGERGGGCVGAGVGGQFGGPVGALVMRLVCQTVLSPQERAVACRGAAVWRR